jgi:uncharacterized protein (TIGR03905 family)
MAHFDYETQGTCARVISFDMDDDHVVTNVKFFGGCDGNLKMISKLVEGMRGEEIVAKCSGNLCRNKGTSCADQLALALEAAAQA